MNVVPDLGMGCVRSAIDRDRAHPYHISAPFPLTHSFPDPPVCHDTLAWVLGTGAFLPVSILWIFQPCEASDFRGRSQTDFLHDLEARRTEADQPLFEFLTARTTAWMTVTAVPQWQMKVFLQLLPLPHCSRLPLKHHPPTGLRSNLRWVSLRSRSKRRRRSNKPLQFAPPNATIVL